MLICKIHECGRTGDRRCCVECDKVPCPGRCLNHPDRCRVWAEEKPQPHGVKRGSVESGRVYELAKQGLTHSAIAEKLGCSITTVNYHLRKFGCTKTKRGGGSG